MNIRLNEPLLSHSGKTLSQKNFSIFNLIFDTSIMLYPVTIGSFRKFIQKKTAYETTAQKNGYSFVHQDFLDPHALIRKSRVNLV